MDTRYLHPQVTELWSLGWTYGAWLKIEELTLEAQLAIGVIQDETVKELLDWLQRIYINEGEVANIAHIEETTKHDVVAFLTRIRGAREKEDARWLHFGLTSSDLVDTTQGMRFRKMHNTVLSSMGTLVSEVNRLVRNDTPVLGRTHGQVAEPMTMRARAYGWLAELEIGVTELSRRTSRMGVCKLSGPVGTYAHNPPEVELQVAAELGLRPHGPGATQIASRAPLAAWASAANLVVQTCAKIAHDVRLMTLVGETKTRMADGQVGSSSMAHKENPIRAERIRGLARMAAGYASMLTDLSSTWLERDIAHSCVERVAVPDLWHVTMFCIEQTCQVLRELEVEWPGDCPGEAHISWLTLRYIEQGHSIEEARQLALIQGTVHPLDARYDQNMQRPSPTVFMANYPGGRDDRG